MGGHYSAAYRTITNAAVPPDQDHAADEQQHADHARQIDLALGEAEPAEMIQCHRGQHLAGDQERDEGGGAELRHEKDRKRDQILVAAGYRVIRVTDRQLKHEPLAVIARIAQALRN